MTPEYPASYIAYLIEFHATRDYFECHELLEEYWKEHPDDGYGQLWVGLIQIAVGSYHERRGNIAGARKMYRHAIGRLTLELLSEAGLNGTIVLAELSRRIEQFSEPEPPPFTDMDLAVTDPELLSICVNQCKDRGVVWGSPSEMGDDSLIHRHTLRDRSGVIAARAASAEAKKRAKPE